jgi:type IV pilus assembly protein PilA
MVIRRGTKGFTLIELMIVVAIIGILAAIAVPNFLRYQAKSRQAEAKSNLGAIYTALEAFRAEYGSYTTDLAVMGWFPAGTPRYNYGFDTDNHDPAGILAFGGSGASAGRHSTDLLPGVVATNMVKNDGTPLTAADLPVTTGLAMNDFTIGASGNLDNDNTLDQWTLTITRVLTNISGQNDVSQ